MHAFHNILCKHKMMTKWLHAFLKSSSKQKCLERRGKRLAVRIITDWLSHKPHSCIVQYCTCMLLWTAESIRTVPSTLCAKRLHSHYYEMCCLLELTLCDCDGGLCVYCSVDLQYIYLQLENSCWSAGWIAEPWIDVGIKWSTVVVCVCVCIDCWYYFDPFSKKRNENSLCSILHTAEISM